MDSIAEEDPTLPIDFDQTTNFANYLLSRKLSNETMDTAATSPETSLSEAFNVDPGVTAKNGDKGSGKKPLAPTKSTMKEQEQQLSTLKKENFELKLRLFYLEGHLQRTYAEDAGDVLKTNVDLRVTIEKLKKENENNQELVQAASKALQKVEEEKAFAIMKVREQLEDEHEREKEALNRELEKKTEELDFMKIEVKALEEKLVTTEHQVEELEEKGKSHKEVAEFELKRVIDPLKSELEEKSRTLESLTEDLNQKNKEIKDLMERQEKNEEVLKSMIEELERTLTDKDNENTELKNQVDELKNTVSELRMKAPGAKREAEESGKLPEVRELKRELRNKAQAIEGYKDYINRTDKVNKELRNSLHETETQQRRSSTAWQETIRRLEALVCSKDKDLSDQRKKITALQDEVRATKHALDKCKKIAAESGQANKLAAELAELRAELELKDHELNDMRNVLDMKEKELESIINGKQKVEEANQQSLAEKDLEILNLREELAQLLEKSRDNSLELDEQIKRLQEDGLQRLSQKERLIRKLANSVHGKDLLIKELTESVIDSSQPSEGEKDSSLDANKVLQSLRDKLREKDEYIEKIIEDGVKASDAKDNELLELRRTLRDKDKSIDRLRRTVVANEGVIKHLEEIGKDKDKTLADLKKSFVKSKKDKKSLQETLLNDAKEKMKEILKLNNLLEMKEKQLQKLLEEKLANNPLDEEKQKEEFEEQPYLARRNVHQDTPRVTVPSPTYPLSMSLDAALKEKERELEELKEELDNLKNAKDSSTQLLKKSLDQKEHEVKGLQEQIKSLKAEEGNALGKLRQTLTDKDAVLEDLIKDSQEKDRIISELKDAKAMAATRIPSNFTSELALIKDKALRLENDLKNKEDRLKSLLEENKFLKNLLEARKEPESGKGDRELLVIQLAEAQKKERDYRLDMEKLGMELSQLKADMKRKESEFENRNRHLAEEVHNFKASLESAKDEAKVKIAAKDKEIESLMKLGNRADQSRKNESATAELQASVEAKIKEIAQLQSLIGGTTAIKEALQSELEDTKRILRGKEDELKKSNALKMSQGPAVESALAEARAVIKEKEDELRRLHEIVADLKERAKDNVLPVTGKESFVDGGVPATKALQDNTPKVARLEKENMALTSVLTELEKKYDSKVEEVKKLQSERSLLEEELTLAFHSEILRKEEERKTAQSQFENEIKKTERLTSQVEILQREIKTMLASSRDRHSWGGQTNDSEDEKLREDLNQIQGVNVFLKKELESQHEVINSLKKRNLELQEEKDGLRNSLSRMEEKITFKDEKLKELASFEERERINESAAAERIIKLASENQTLKSGLDELQILNEKLREKLNQVNAAFEACKSKYEEDIRSYREQYINSSEKLDITEDSLRQESGIVINLRDQLRLVESEASKVKLLSEELKKSQGLNRALRSELENLSSTSALEKTLAEPVISSLKEQIVTLQEKNAKLEREAEEARGEAAKLVLELQSQVNNLERELKEARLQLQDEAQKQARMLELQNSRTEQAVVDLKEEVRILQQSNTKLSFEAEEARRKLGKQIPEYERQVRDLELQVTEVESRLQEEAKSEAKSEAKLSALGETISSLRSVVEELEEENRSLQEKRKMSAVMAEELERVQDELEKLRTRKERLEDRVKELDSSTLSLREELTRLKMDNSTQANTISRLTETLAKQADWKQSKPVALAKPGKVVSTQTLQLSDRSFWGEAEKRDEECQTSMQWSNETDSSGECDLRQEIDELLAENRKKEQLIVSFQDYIENMKGDTSDQGEHPSFEKSKEDLVLALIQEMRELRARLTDSIKNNDELKKRLEEQLSRSGNENNNFRIPDVAISVSYENEALRKKVVEKDEIIRNLKEKIEQLNTEREEDKEKMKSLHRQIRELKDISINLRQELSIYEHLHQRLESATQERSSGNSPDSKGQTDGDAKLDHSILYTLLEAIRKLHSQLDRTMEDNHALRKKLEEHLGHLVLDTPPSKPPSALEEEKDSCSQSPRSGSVKRNLFSAALHSVDVSPRSKEPDVPDIGRYFEDMPTKDIVTEVIGDMKCPRETYANLKVQLADGCDKLWRTSQTLTALSSKPGKDNKTISDLAAISTSALSCLKIVINLINTEFSLLDEQDTKGSEENSSEENEKLRREILVLKKKLRHQDNLIRKSLSKLEASKRKKDDELSGLVNSVQETYQVMKYARETLSSKMQQAKTGHLVVSPKH